jgi:hypothetical protein
MHAVCGNNGSMDALYVTCDWSRGKALPCAVDAVYYEGLQSLVLKFIAVWK